MSTKPTESLYHLSATMEVVLRKLEAHDGDLDAAGVEALMDQTTEPLQEKLRSTGWVVELAAAELRELAYWEERLADRKKAVTSLHTRLSRYMAESMKRAEVQEVRGQAPMDLAEVQRLLDKAVSLSGPRDRAERTEILVELRQAIGQKPPLAWKWRETPGKAKPVGDLDADLLREQGLLREYPIQLVSKDPEPNKAEIQKRLRAGEEVEGWTLAKEVKLC